MLKVFALQDNFKDEFAKLFSEYYSELGCDDDCGHLIDEYILPDLLAGLLRIDLMQDGDALCGFVIYQKDDIDNDWNFKEGWGDIREIYISPEFRKRGYGKFLLYTAEMKLKERGVNRAYCLPYASSVPFFIACGYTRTEQYSEELDCHVYIKEDLNNKCK